MTLQEFRGAFRGRVTYDSRALKDGLMPVRVYPSKEVRAEMFRKARRDRYIIGYIADKPAQTLSERMMAFAFDALYGWSANFKKYVEDLVK